MHLHPLGLTSLNICGLISLHNEMHDTSGGKGHIQVRVGISESHYGANQAIYKPQGLAGTFWGSTYAALN